jgi:DNA polymerase-3 subunit alpha (Gram-positive type)
MMSEEFKKTFKRLTFSAQDNDLLKNMTEYKVRVDKASKALEIDMRFSKLVDYRHLFSLEDNIRKTYELNRVRIFPSYPAESFSADCTKRLVETLKRYFESSIGYGFFEGCKSEYDANERTLTIELRKNCSAELQIISGSQKFFEDCIKHQFELNIKVNIEGKVSDEFYEPMGAQELKIAAGQAYQQIKAEESHAEKQSSFEPVSDEIEVIFDDENPNIVSSGGLKFDISEPQVIYGKGKLDELMPIRKIEDGMKVRFVGQVFDVESKENYDGNKINYKIYITDLDSSIMVRVAVDKDTPLDLKAPTAVIAEGKAAFNKFDDEVIVRGDFIASVKRIRRKDGHPTPRVELHLHTNMSTLDALTDPMAVMKTASDWGMPAVAITDHGNVQAFPEIMKACKKVKDVKPLYGMEGYLVDDTARAVFNYNQEHNISFKDGTFIIFDIETTGLSPRNCGITQIGAVKFKGGEIIDRFETFVNPGMPIPENITQLTGITDEMVKDAPSQCDAVKAFLDFAEEHMLVAHNAPFDVGFIRKVATDNKLKFENPYLDTVSLSRFLNTDISKHTLDSLARYFSLGEFDHHRAGDDTEMLAKIFVCMIKKLAADGIADTDGMVEAMARNCDPKKLKYYHIIILVKNQAGLKNLYKLISRSYIDYFHRFPRIPKTLLKDYREGLILGSACVDGELYQAILDNKPYADLIKIASFYDYLEIQPNSNNYFLVEEEKLGENKEAAVKQLCDNIKKIIELGEKLKKPVCATGDVHFLDPEDEIYRKIMQYGMGFTDKERDTRLYFKTTQEMLDEFAFLGNEKAEEVVITNPRMIADMVEPIKPIPDGQYTPSIEGSEEELINICHQTARDMYGDPIPEIVQKRLDKELNSIIKNGFAVLYIIARRLVRNSEEHGYLVGSRGSVGSSVVAILAGISEVNPLPPHYRCPNCKKSIFFTDGSVGSGFDLPDKLCDECGTKMIQDGHDIPFETFLGFHGEKAPDIDLNFSGDVQKEAHKFTEVLFGKENIFRAGTVGTLQSKTCYGFVKDYLASKNKNLTKAEQNRLVSGMVGVKRTTGQHPGGIVVVPKEYEIYDFTPIQHPADKATSGVITTHFAFEYLHDTLLKLDILGHDAPTLYKMFERYTGIDVRTVPMNDPDVMELLSSTKSIGVQPSDIGSEIGTFGLPELGTKYVRQMIMDTKPKMFSDLLQISGLSHGTGIWLGNGDELIKNGTATIKEIIGTRDDIMVFLMYKGVESSMAFKIMESVRKGKGLTEEMEDAMRKNNVPEWYIGSCKKIKYMFPKAHAAAYLMAALRIGWFKVHYPVEYYASYFTVKSDSFDGQLVMQGAQAVRKKMEELESMPETTAKDEDTIVFLQIAAEMLARGIEFLPVDIYKSEAFAFVPENGKIRLPLSALNGLGEKAAENIYNAIRSGRATTLEELKTEASLNKTVVEILKQNNCLADLPESDQLSLF